MNKYIIKINKQMALHISIIKEILGKEFYLKYNIKETKYIYLEYAIALNSEKENVNLCIYINNDEVIVSIGRVNIKFELYHNRSDIYQTMVAIAKMYLTYIGNCKYE